MGRGGWYLAEVYSQGVNIKNNKLCIKCIVRDLPPGYYSWRNEGTGSWFMQALCEMLKKHSSQLELMQIMTRVNHKVALDFESFTLDPGSNKKKQMPSIITTLTKDFYFR